MPIFIPKTHPSHPLPSRQPLRRRQLDMGFQKIFVVNLPSRTDRRDMFELMAVDSGIEVEFVRAV